MEAEFNILVKDEELNCTVSFIRYRDTNQDEPEIVINTIKCNGSMITEGISHAHMNKLKERCEAYYNHKQFEWMQERSKLM